MSITDSGVYEYPLKCRVSQGCQPYPFWGTIPHFDILYPRKFRTPFRFLSLECDKTPYQGLYECPLLILVYIRIH
ncbi:unnamed protein product [Rotaria sp. Silwood1]|nr:unnamed protein product [Rotaria sp. Silwood1]CAF1689299.1 unnamed protein product [Rotaria sp. Silwood1]